jgi:hypothetical protein
MLINVYMLTRLRVRMKVENEYIMKCETMIKMRFLQPCHNRLLLSGLHTKKREYVRQADEELNGLDMWHVKWRGEVHKGIW